MSRYGISYYDLAYYGATDTAPYIATNFKATATNYNNVVLTWASPSGNWSKIKLVRNSYGFPVNAFDGNEIDIVKNGEYFAFKETDPTTYVDTEVGDNSFYYYSLFIFETTGFTWRRVGNALVLSPKNYGYSDTLYNYLPQIYKTSTLGDPFGNYYNQDLYNFLSLFGYQLDNFHTFINILVNRYDVQRIGGTLIPAFLQQFGLEFEPEIGIQQSKILLQAITLLLKEKGAKEGLIEYLKSYTGYGVLDKSTAPNPNDAGIRMGKNLMLDYNDSSFEESIGHWDVNTELFPEITGNGVALCEEKIKTMRVYNNNLYLTPERALRYSPTWGIKYAYHNEIFIKDLPYPAFNATTSPKAIQNTSNSYVSVLVTNPDMPWQDAYNYDLKTYPTITPYPVPWNEPTATEYYPNRQKGIMSVSSILESQGDVYMACGLDSPITKGIPVEGDTDYTFSIYTAAANSTRDVAAIIHWYDYKGTYLGSDEGDSFENTTGVFETRVWVTSTSRTDAAYAVPSFVVYGVDIAEEPEYHYFDAAQFEVGDLTDFEDARIVHITLEANRVNELVNPHFGAEGMGGDPTPWTATGATLSVMQNDAAPGTTFYPASYLTLTSGIATLESFYTNDIPAGKEIVVRNVAGVADGAYMVTDRAEAVSGAYAYVKFDTGTSDTAARTAVTGEFFLSGDTLMVMADEETVTVSSWDLTTTGQQMPIYYPGFDYTFSVYCQGGDVTDTVTLSIEWYDISNVLIDTTTGATVNVINDSGGDAWDRYYVTGVAPATAAYATVNIIFETTIGNMFHLDASLFERKSFAFPFFDGDEGPSDITDFMWEGGVAHQARSHYYKNFSTMRGRLLTTALNDYLMLGTSIAIHYAQPRT